MAKERVILSGSKGFEGKEYDKESSVIIKLTDGFYHKNDSESVAKVNGRFYRTNSPLIVPAHNHHQTFFGERYIIKTDAAEYGGAYVRSEDLKTVTFVGEDGFYDEKVLVYLYNNYSSLVVLTKEGKNKRVFYKSSEFITKHFILDEISRGYVERGHKDLKVVNSITLTSPSNRFSLDTMGFESIISRLKSTKNLSASIKKSHTILSKYLTEEDGEFYTKHSFLYLTRNDGTIGKTLRLDKVASLPLDERIKLIDSTFKQVEVFMVGEVIDSPSKFSRNLGNAVIHKTYMYVDDESSERFKFSPMLGIVCDVTPEEMIESKAYASYAHSLKDVVSGINTGAYGKQPAPLFLPTNFGNQGGNFLYHESPDRSLKISPTKLSTGGVGYTFGVELETSYGLLPKPLVEKNGCKAVGDRSIGALEYVTKPLHGDAGMKSLMDLVSDLGKFTHVDSRCGLHVHVGGSKDTDSPAFNRAFSVYAIKLGLMVQDEMFSIMPPHRLENKNRDGVPYCGRIDEGFASISMKNWKEALGMYVYGRPFSDENNSRTRLFRWTPSRYRWLNLVNCNSDNGGRSDAGSNSAFKTIEFRIFEGTLNAVDIQSFVLLSLAFTKFVDCHQRLIDKGNVDLEFIIRKTLNKSCAEQLINWVKERKSINK